MMAGILTHHLFRNFNWMCLLHNYNFYIDIGYGDYLWIYSLLFSSNSKELDISKNYIRLPKKFVFYEVSKDVNKLTNNTASLIQKVTD